MSTDLGYHPYTWHMEPPSTDGQKLVGTTKAVLEGRTGSKIDMQKGSSLNIGGVMTLTSDGSLDLNKGSSMYVGGSISLTSDAKLKVNVDSFIRGEVRWPATDIATYTSDNNYLPNHGICLIEQSTKPKSTGPRFFVAPPTTAGQRLTIIPKSSHAYFINFNCSSTHGFLSKRCGLFNTLTGKTSGLLIKLTTDFKNTGEYDPSKIDLVSMSTGAWLVLAITVNSSIVDKSKCYTVTSTT